MDEASQLERAIDRNDFDRVKALMTSDPALHAAPLGYGGDGPLTWVAECRVPWEPPSPDRLAMAAWMIEHGSDVHQGGDAPLMRAALQGYRIPMMELLVSHGADVNALWHGSFPIVFAPCESLDPEALKWLLDHGADPNRSDHGYEVSGHSYSGTALDYVMGSYARSPERLSACIEPSTTAQSARRGCRRRKERGSVRQSTARFLGREDGGAQVGMTARARDRSRPRRARAGPPSCGSRRES